MIDPRQLNLLYAAREILVPCLYQGRPSKLNLVVDEANQNILIVGYGVQHIVISASEIVGSSWVEKSKAVLDRVKREVEIE